ncbi:hypothetical protein FOS14_11720 [Skermania sp. ID1734]|uniref:hypothetical protein n=1 Tax=Skermania sp. ID1734 TaxID=2597516 RepID=UPI00117F850D|nr:hypothetical protein [Skermania sp. ID1734]TSD99451.1 hypothetical protein FOS14_11720 [Skermania sp. ID1734]
MNLRKTVTFLAAAVLATATMGIATTTASADPVSSPPGPIQYQTRLVDRTMTTSLDGGTFTVTADGSGVVINDASGHAVVELPLTTRIHNVSYPMSYAVTNAGRTLSVTAPASMPGVTSVASAYQNQQALNNFNALLGPAMQAGGPGGTVVGAIAGCIFGFWILPVPCLTGAVIGGVIGGAIGTGLAGGQPLLAAGMNVITTYLS